MLRPEVVDHRPTWKSDFEAIDKEIREALGPLVLRVDHIGSTAVADLCSKDVIDVQVTVEKLDQTAISPALERAGFRGRPEIVGDHRPPGHTGRDEDWLKLYFDRAPDDGRRVHVHVRGAGRANQRYALVFRDYLRAHPDVADAYGEFKRRLAPLCADTHTYADAKDPVCDIIIAAAEEWAERTGWKGSA